jgi:hypothetical protein
MSSIRPSLIVTGKRWNEKESSESDGFFGFFVFDDGSATVTVKRKAHTNTE